MSGVEIAIGVIAGVAALVSALNDGTELTEKVKTRWQQMQDARAKKKKLEQEEPAMVSLQTALTTGRNRIIGTYNDFYRSMGERFAIGDATAINELQAYKIVVLEQIILNMRGDSMTMNYPTFSSVALGTQQKTIDSLSTLGQRLLLAAPIQQALPWQRNIADHSRFPVGFVTEIGEIQQDERSIRSLEKPRSIPEEDERRESFTPSEVASSFDHLELELNPWQGEVVPKPKQVTSSPKAIPSGRRDSAGPSRLSVGAISPYRGSPLTPQDSNEDIPSALTPISSTPISTTSSSPPARSSFSSYRPSIGSRIFSLSRTRTSFSSSSRTSMSQDSLPSESNKFLGLCKGAWRLQSGADESAMTIGRSPVNGSLTQTTKHWVCATSGCHFQSFIIRHDDEADRRRRIQFSEQLVFKWTFLFKCHLPTKSGNNKAYGCMLCASPGTVGALPVYGGDRAFLQHIQDTHIGDGKWPEEGPATYRAGCVVKPRMPIDDTPWDILLIRQGPVELDANPPSPRIAASPPSLDMHFEGFGTFDISGNDEHRTRDRRYSRT